jgi:predicted restriction endonuclease
MIENCVYDKTFDIHRYVWGKDGGKYEIGNMFAICPNHHAEITRKIISVVKVDDKTLRVGP